jgi:hypothetical protein
VREEIRDLTVKRIGRQDDRAERAIAATLDLVQPSRVMSTGRN